MQITNPRPESNRAAQAPTRDEVPMGLPRMLPLPNGMDFGAKPLESPLGAQAPRPGLNDTPLNIQERES